MRRLIAALAVLALIAGAIAVYGRWVERRFVAGQVPLRPVPSDQLAAHVRSIAGVAAGDLVNLLVAGASIGAFAARAVRGRSNDVERAVAIVSALQERAKRGAFVEWTRVDPRDGPPLTASQTWNAIARDGAHRQLYPLELAVLAVAALRSRDVPALVAEVYRYPLERSALDASGRLGYYAVFLPDAGANAGRLFDAYAGRKVAPSDGDYAVLNDAQVVGAALAIRALHRLKNVFDTAGAVSDADAALKLLPKSPSAHSVRAEVGFAFQSGGPNALAELETALKLRPDAARHLNIAIHALARQDREGARANIQAALDEAPEYALALVVKAAYQLAQSDMPGSFASLQSAKKLEPNLAMLPQVEAQFHAKMGDLDLALASAAESVKRRPRDPQPLFILARIERLAGHEADMRKHARQIIDYVPAADRERRQLMLRSMFAEDLFDADHDAGVRDAQAPAR